LYLFNKTITVQDIKQRLQHILETTDWSANDRQWLFEYLEQNDSSVLRQVMQQEFAAKTSNGYELDDESAKHLLALIHEKIKPAGRVTAMNLWKRVTAAAAVIIIIAGAFFLFNQLPKKDQQLTGDQPPAADITPGGNKAVLTLSDNTVVILDNAQNGTLSQQGNTKVLKVDDGQLVYNTTGETKELLYNTISTPRGGQYQMTLSDGSKVWLNAASSIKFPVAFSGNERKVEITGEAYFEVAPLSLKGGQGKAPFIVNVAGKQEVEVLGTHFNINSYPDEASINTTLLEGKVKVTPVLNSQLTPDSYRDDNSQLLFPGQQSQLNTNGQISLNKNPNVEQVMAWKNGIFNFDNADLNMVLRQLSRWYDVDIVFEGPVPQRIFEGEMQRDLKLSQVLRILEKNNVHFRIEGKKLIILK
jgi:ferric-dicitrate binding protein FerR (iron transport regulator)